MEERGRRVPASQDFGWVSRLLSHSSTKESQRNPKVEALMYVLPTSPVLSFSITADTIQRVFKVPGYYQHNFGSKHVSAQHCEHGSSFSSLIVNMGSTPDPATAPGPFPAYCPVPVYVLL